MPTTPNTQPHPHPRQLTRLWISALVGACAWSASSVALAQPNAPATPGAAAPLPGQKPPCVPASSYALGYDCELFPLPSGATPATGASPAPVAPVAPGAAVVVTPAPAAVPASSPAPASPPADSPPPESPPPASPPPASSATSSNSPSHAPAYITYALGAGGAGMAAAFGILALKTNSTLSGECSKGACPASASSTVSKLTLYQDLTDVGLGVAVAGVAIGTILFLTEHGSTSQTGSRHIDPWVGLGAAGVRGTF